MVLTEPALSLPQGVLVAGGRAPGSVTRLAPGIVALLGYGSAGIGLGR